jgi:hypothetical protein
MHKFLERVGGHLKNAAAFGRKPGIERMVRRSAETPD